MSSYPDLGKVVYETGETDIETYAREKASKYGELINKTPEEARRTMERLFQSILSKMEVGDEDEMPVPPNGNEDKWEVCTLKKLDKERFSFTCREWN